MKIFRVDLNEISILVETFQYVSHISTACLHGFVSPFPNLIDQHYLLVLWQ